MVSDVFEVVIWGFFVLGACAFLYLIGSGVVRRLRHESTDWHKGPTDGHVRMPGAAGLGRAGTWEHDNGDE